VAGGEDGIFFEHTAPVATWSAIGTARIDGGDNRSRVWTRQETDPAQGLRESRAVVQDWLKTLQADLDRGGRAPQGFPVRTRASRAVTESR
jgi:hypothetical protein